MLIKRFRTRFSNLTTELPLPSRKNTFQSVSLCASKLIKMPEEKYASSTLFSIGSDNKDFAARQKNIFDQLNVAELNRINEQKSKITEPTNSEDIEEADVKTEKSITKQFRGQKSIFKTPSIPLRKALASSRIPDHSVNPHKWTKYSLEDVKSEDMSERSNTAAAFSFLKEIESRKGKAEMETSNLEKKIVFQKSVMVQHKLEDGQEEEKTRFKSSKLIMPEYIVGQKIKNEKKKRSTKSKNPTKQLRLDHLMEDEEQDN